MAAAQVTLPLTILLIYSLCMTIATETATATPSSSASTNFIKSKCSFTTYPALCYQSLSSYASVINQSPRQLARTAMMVSSSKAHSTKTFITNVAKMKGLKKREMAAVKDCLEEVNDTIDRLKMSLDELSMIKGVTDKDFQWHISNVETWMSAALTDEITCVDGFAGKGLNGSIKESIKARILNVAHVTSNALALVNQYAAN
ncbi:unnamed protein product [Rhodiola kirilowii]